MIDIVIILMYIAVAAALGATVWAVVRTMLVVGKTSGKIHGVPVRRINVITITIVILSLLLSFAFANTSPMHINATEYNDVFWLRVANMFVFTGTLTIAIAALATLFNFLYNRK